MSLHSMTGFGRAVAQVGDRRFVVEIRSVNGRGLDTKVRMRFADAVCELEIARAVRAAVERGSVLVVVRPETGGAQDLQIDGARLERTHAELETVRRRLGLAGSVDLATVAAFLQTGSEGGEPEAGEPLWEALRPAVTAALGSLREMRGREGEALAQDLLRRSGHLRKLVERMSSAAQGEPARVSARIAERIKSLAVDVAVDPQRLAQEAAILADRLDVSEELTRLTVHLDHLDSLVGAGGAAGRKLDFVVQEVARELNTTGSKSQDATLTALVIEAKAELERVREQAQNVE